MKIFFETSAMCRRYGGISVYVSSLLRALMEQFPECEYHTGFKSVRGSAWEEYLRNAGNIMHSGLHIHRMRIPGRLDLSSIPLFIIVTANVNMVKPFSSLMFFILQSFLMEQCHPHGA